MAFTLSTNYEKTGTQPYNKFCWKVSRPSGCKWENCPFKHSTIRCQLYPVCEKKCTFVHDYEFMDKFLNSIQSSDNEKLQELLEENKQDQRINLGKYVPHYARCWSKYHPLIECLSIKNYVGAKLLLDAGINIDQSSFPLLWMFYRRLYIVNSEFEKLKPDTDLILSLIQKTNPKKFNQTQRGLEHNPTILYYLYREIHKTAQSDERHKQLLNCLYLLLIKGVRSFDQSGIKYLDSKSPTLAIPRMKMFYFYHFDIAYRSIKNGKSSGDGCSFYQDFATDCLFDDNIFTVVSEFL